MPLTSYFGPYQSLLTSLSSFMRVKIALGAKFVYMAIRIFGSNGSDKQKGRLQGKVAIVTGAGTGIGEAIVHKFAKEGANVIVCGLPDDPIEDVAKAIRQDGGEALAFGGDTSEEH